MTVEQRSSLLLRGTVHDVTPGPLPMNSAVTTKLSGAEKCWWVQHLEMVALKLKHLLLKFLLLFVSSTDGFTDWTFTSVRCWGEHPTGDWTLVIIDYCKCLVVCLFVGCLTSQQHASVSQGRICTDNFTCCHTEIEVADPTFYLTQSQYNDTGRTSPSTDPITPGAWQGSHWSANF